MFAVRLHLDSRNRAYVIRRAGTSGWEARLEEDGRAPRVDCDQDWHRVERALARFEREVTELTEHGWQVASVDIRH